MLQTQFVAKAMAVMYQHLMIVHFIKLSADVKNTITKLQMSFIITKMVTPSGVIGSTVKVTLF